MTSSCRESAADAIFHDGVVDDCIAFLQKP